jgi:hypothetical protein
VNEKDLGNKEFSAKLDLAIKDAEAAMTQMKEAGNSVSSTPGAITDKRMGFAAHTQTIEEMLAAEGTGASCAVANATLNELATIRTKDGAIVGGLTAVTSIGFGIAGGLVARGAAAGVAASGSAAVGGNLLGALAFMTGAAGGIYQDFHEMSEADDSARNARVGLVKPEDANKELAGRASTVLLGALNFQGAGTAIGGLVGAGSVLTKYAIAKTVKDSAKGGGGAMKNSATKAVEQLSAAQAGDKAAGEAVLKAAAAEEAKLFGHAPTAAEKAPIEEVLKKGLAGTPENPDTAIVEAYAANVRALEGKAEADYLKSVSTVTAGLKPASELGDAARQRAVAEAVVNSGEANPQATIAILNDKKNWNDVAVNGRTAIEKEMKKFKGTVKEKFAAAWESLRVKAGLAKEKPEVVAKRCDCGGFGCSVGVRAQNEAPWNIGEPSFVACAAP